MADPRAERLVNQLKDAGWTGRQIGAAIDRDASLVNQIGRGARGPGYGSNAVPALQQLASGAQQAAVPRRTTAEGTEARVRRPVVRTPAGTVASGRRFGTVMRDQLAQAAAQGRHVRVDMRTRRGGRATAYRKGGINAGVLQQAIAEFGGFVPALRGLGNGQGVSGLADDDVVTSIDLTVL